MALVFVLVLQSQAQDGMRKTVEYLASQELGGRFPATAGDTLASKYITGMLRGMKLKPIVKGKKEKGFYQDFNFSKKDIVTEKTTEYNTHNTIAGVPGKYHRLQPV